MSTLHTVQTVFEIVLVAGVIVALFHEPAIAKWEEKKKEKIIKTFNERKRYRK